MPGWPRCHRGYPSRRSPATRLPASRRSRILAAARATAGRQPARRMDHGRYPGRMRAARQPSHRPARLDSRPDFGFAGVATADLLALTPPGALAGMTGATAAGGSWRIGQSLLLVNDDPEGAAP